MAPDVQDRRPDGESYQGQYGNDRDDGPHGSHAVSLTSTVAHSQTGCSSGPGAASAGGGQGGEERGEGSEGMGTDDGVAVREGGASAVLLSPEPNCHGEVAGGPGRIKYVDPRDS